MEDRKEAQRLRWKAQSYIYFERELLRRKFTASQNTPPYLKCLKEEDVDYVLREIYEGACGNHAGSRTLTYKALGQGFYWQTMMKDTVDLVRRCDKCQMFGSIAKVSAAELTPIINPVPFAQWGLDYLGPFTPASG